MTIHIADIASYQGGLSLADLAAAGFTGVNLKVSHGVTQKSVHPSAAAFAPFALSSFHWLTGDSGVMQADYAYACMAILNLNLPGTVHVVDVEDSAVTAGVYVDYVARMTKLLGRPIVTYTGDWYAETRPWLQASVASPWLWSAPVPGYQPAYPGDESPLWDDGYGGWQGLSIMQYRVSEIAGIKVSQSAIRDQALWNAMTGGQMASQAYYDWLDDGQPWEYSVPIRAMGDRLRAHGYTVYYQGNEDHLKKATPEDHTPFSATGWPGKSPYPYCMACDIMPPASGQKSKLTGKPLPSLQALAQQLYDDKQAGYGPAKFVKYMNWEPEGNYTGPCYHDSWMPDHERESSGDRGHIHVSGRTDYYLSTASNSYDLVARTLGDDDMTPAEMTAWAKSPEGKEALGDAFLDNVYGSGAYPGRTVRAFVKDVHAMRDYMIGDGKGAALAGIKDGSYLDIVGEMAQNPPTIDVNALAAAIVALLPEIPPGTLTPADVETAVRNVLTNGVGVE
jgi:hypothetical protein